MHFKHFYNSCLSQASYMIGSEGEAAVADPQRDVDHYIREAEERGLRIRWVIETHLHADFVSGHRELAARTGAQVVFGAKAGAIMPHTAVTEGDELRVGKARMRVMETPGHTPESVSILIDDTEMPGRAPKVLTGDALFIGDVGRPDLVGSRGNTASQMAGMLYDSLHDKLLKLDDGVEVWPAHGAGSLCGRNLSDEASSTIGQQRRYNYALQPMSRDDFVRMMTTDLPEVPPYFARAVEINLRGAVPLAELTRPAAMPAEAVREMARAGAVLLDLRDAVAFGQGHAPGALNISLEGQFASWAGSLIPFGAPIILVADQPGQVQEAFLRLARIGMESVQGYLEAGMPGWRAAGLETARLEQISVAALKAKMSEGASLQVLDVRRPPEYAAGHAPGSVNVPLGQDMTAALSGLDPHRPTAVICLGGFRSAAAASILAGRGFSRILNVAGGTDAWRDAGYPIQESTGDRG